MFAAPDVADASCIPGFDYGAFSKGCPLKFAGGAVTDSYDSSLGSYALTKTNSNGNIGTNGTLGGCVSLNGATTDINGSIDVGPGGSSTTISVAGGATFDGSPNPNVLSAPLAMPSVTIPVVGTNQGDQTGGIINLAANQTYGDVSIAGGGTLTLNSGDYVMNSLKLTGGSTVVLNITTGPVKVYIVSDLDISGGTITNATGISTNLLFFAGPLCANIKLSGGAQAAYAVYAPDSAIQLTGGGEIFGAVVGASITDLGGTLIHYDQALKTATGNGLTCVPVEASRASPVIATIQGSASGSLVQGSFEAATGPQPVLTTVASLTTWSFPFLKGHVRARVASSVVTSSLTAGTVLFDAGSTTAPTIPGGIPAANNAGCGSFNTSCRQIFTNTNTPGGTTTLPAILQLNDTNASTIGAIITASLAGFGAAEWQTIVRTILAGKLGGVDRSTVAVIEQSTVAGTTRPKMAYFGATDGMLHAVCASTGTAACPVGSLGKELWAFLPRVQLPLIPGNTTRIDGSVHVLDVFGAFPTPVAGSPYSAATPATTTNSFRTILLFQTGFAIGTKAAAYAIDVTDPAKPVVLWEYATPTAPASVDFGAGMAVAAGPTIIGAATKNFVVLETNNGGSTATTTHAMVATGLNTVDGTLAWQFTHTYTNPPRGVALDVMPVPPQSIPGGAVGVDLSGGSLGYTTNYVMGDLYGNLWRLDAATGSPPTTGSGFNCTLGGSALAGCVPIFSFAANKHPIGALPVVFARVSGGDQFVGFASGGYVDPVATIWSTSNQRLMAVKIKPSTLPETEATSACALSTCNVLVNATFTNANDKAFAQALVVGTKLFITTDSTDVNLASYATGTTATGSIYSADILAGATTVLAAPGTVFHGVNGLANDNAANTAYTGMGDSKATSTTGGIGIDPNAQPKFTRRVWARTNN